jgi:hypothetical protein
MSDIQIEIVTKTITQPEGKKYKQMEVIYKNLSFQGKVENKKIIDFYAKEIWPALEDAKKGDVFTVSRAKEGEYWTWKGITAGANAGKSSTTGGSAPVSSGGATTGRTYVADDVKQVMIIRQSSIASAVRYYGENDVTPEQVIDTAKKFEAYVLGKDKETDTAGKPPKAALPAELDDDLGDLPI